VARRSGFHRASGSSRRKTAWGVGPGDSSPVVLTGSGATILGLGTTPTTQLGLTVVRLRGLLGFTMISGTAIGDGFTGAVGVGVFTASAFAIGVTAMPQPVTEMDWGGWMWHQFIDMRVNAANVFDGVMQGLRVDVDSKAMRKLTSDEFVLGAIIEVTEVGTAQIEVSFDSRVLLKIA